VVVDTGEITVNDSRVIKAKPITGVALEILLKGGLLNYLKGR
jgi:3-isopropylmalate/(R)-2-methylmalate dehydratase small subunit